MKEIDIEQIKCSKTFTKNKRIIYVIYKFTYVKLTFNTLSKLPKIFREITLKYIERT